MFKCNVMRSSVDPVILLHICSVPMFVIPWLWYFETSIVDPWVKTYYYVTWGASRCTAHFLIIFINLRLASPFSRCCFRNLLICVSIVGLSDIFGCSLSPLFVSMWDRRSKVVQNFPVWCYVLCVQIFIAFSFVSTSAVDCILIYLSVGEWAIMIVAVQILLLRSTWQCLQVYG